MAATLIARLENWFEDQADVFGALQRVQLTGRMQRSMVDHGEVILDVAHNPAAASLLADNMTKPLTASHNRGGGFDG